MADTTAPMPLPNLAMVDPSTGTISEVWFRFFTALLTRTGGEAGNLAPVVTVTLGASPYVYTLPAAGAVLLSGGGVIRLEYISAKGMTWYPAGQYYAPLPLASGARVRVTYVGAPSLRFLPG